MQATKNKEIGAATRLARWPWVIIALVSVFALGCPGKPPPAPPVLETVVIKVACPSPIVKRLIERYGKSWAAAQHARLEFVDSDQEADLRMIRPVDLPRLAEAGTLAAVPDSIRGHAASFGWMNLLPLYRNKLLTWNDTAYALPLLGDVTVCFYRADLLGDPKHQAAFREKFGHPLEPPRTWEDFAQIAEFFQGRQFTHSLPSLPEQPEELDRLFFSIAAPYARRGVLEDEPKKPRDRELFSFHYDLETLEPRIDRPAFVHALKLLQRLQSLRPAGFTAPPADAFRQGQAVFCIGSSDWVGRFSANDSHVREMFAVCRLPGSRFYFDFETGKEASANLNHIPYVGVGGWLGVVSKSSVHSAEAFDLLALLGNGTTSTEVVLDSNFAGAVFRREHLDSRTPWTILDLGSERTRGLVDALRAQASPEVINPVVRLRTPDQAKHQQVLIEALREATKNRDADAASVLQGVAKRWRELDAGKPIDARRREYRLSLSLSPDGKMKP